jgi:hypothetical protein
MFERLLTKKKNDITLRVKVYIYDITEITQLFLSLVFI